MIVQPYSSTATYNWTTTGLAPSTYYYTVWARDATSATSYDSYFAASTYTLTSTSTACTSVTDSPSAASPQASGTTITFTAVASGSPSPPYHVCLAPPRG